MNFSQREMKSRSDSFILGFGTGIENHTGNTLRGKFNAFGENPCPQKCIVIVVHLRLALFGEVGKRRGRYLPCLLWLSKVTVTQQKPSRPLTQK
jgi:hypothetical protein